MFGKKVEKAVSDWPTDKINPKKGTLQIVGQYATPSTALNVWMIALLLTVPLAIFAGGIGIAMILPLFPFIWMMMQKHLRVGPESYSV